MTARNGKIARLPHEAQELVNLSLRRNMPTPPLLEYLNEQPEIKEMLSKEFGGEPINKQNLSAWRQGGYLEWETRQEWRTDARELKEYAVEMLYDGSSSLVERLTVVLAGRYASILLKWDGQPDEQMEKKLKLLGRLNRDVLALQRGHQREYRQRQEGKKHEWAGLEFAHKAEGWAAEQHSATQVAPVMVEMMKSIMDKLGFNYGDLEARAEKEAKKKAKAEKRKAKEAEKAAKSEARNQKSERNPKAKGKKPERSTSNVQRPTLKEEKPTPGPSQGGEPAKKPRSEVAEDEGASRPVKVGQGESNRETRNQKSEGNPKTESAFAKATADEGEADEKRETSETERPTSNVQHPTSNEKGPENRNSRSDAPRSDAGQEGGAAQWN